jgi:fumarate hydratase class II
VTYSKKNLNKHRNVVMVGRTHLQDATQLTLGQIVSGWAAQLDQALDGIRQALPGVYACNRRHGVGAGLNADPRFGEIAARRIAKETGQPFVSAPQKFAALSAHDGMVSVSGALRTLAGALLKIATDVRWYVCGPRSSVSSLASSLIHGPRPEEMTHPYSETSDRTAALVFNIA